VLLVCSLCCCVIVACCLLVFVCIFVFVVVVFAVRGGCGVVVCC